MYAITHDNLSHAWLAAVEYLVERPKGKAAHLVVAVQRPDEAEDERIRSVLDAFVERRRNENSGIFPIDTVANTLFPIAFYRAGRDNARERLYELHARAQRIQERLREPENYFNRLVAYPTSSGEPFNQLEFIVDRLIKQRKPRKDGRRGALSSAYEMGTSLPAVGDLRIHAPGEDKNTMGFPCLSHLSLTLDEDSLCLAALYRNQHFIDRAYGNYVGLSRLARFVANEVGVEVGEVLCVATHADVQFGDHRKDRVRQLVATARAAADGHALEAVTA